VIIDISAEAGGGSFMSRLTVIWVAFALFGYAALCPAQSNTRLSSNTDGEHFGTVINQYCVGCHNDVLRTAGLSLQQLDINAVGAGAETWEKVLRKLKVRTMPPSGMPRPDIDTYDAFAKFLESELDSYAELYPRPGVASLRRLNRTEYFNAVRDLLAVKINDDTILPADDTMFGFDNVGNVLTLSPLLAEQYITAARVIRRQALGDPDMQPEFNSYTVPRYLMQEDWIGEELPFGTRGGTAVRHHFPMDGEYVLQVRLQRNSRDYIRGLINKPHRLDIRLDGNLIKTFSVGGEKLGRSSGILSTSAQGDVEQEQYERYFDEALEIRFPAKSGTRLISVAFQKDTMVPEQPLYSSQSIIDYAQYKGGVPGVDAVTIGGPYNAQVSADSESREKIFVCRPVGSNDTVCAKRILSALAHRAYRRPASDAEIKGLMDFYRQGHEEGGFDEGIGLAIERILAGPRFLFITEQAQIKTGEDGVYRISDLELATRLSLFLWSSIPDDELLEIAESGQLGDPDVLNQQVQRMLDDPRSGALVDNFASQWLTLMKLNASAPDGELFPYFDDNLREAFQQETKLFFNHVLRRDRPLLELLDADYTFLNERLAKHYGIADIYGNHFRKVTLTDGTRGGLLGQGSILTVTSYANRTAPTIRGKWILENILGAPPPPPPANVPGLRDKNNEGKVLSMREQMEQHRANPVCASCHKVMDPLGFALENFDAIGKWRTIDAASSSAIDASGSLPDGSPFEGLAGLRQVLLEKREYDFVVTVVEKLLTYALGREIMHTDAPVIRSIIRKTAAEDYRLSSIIKAIVESTPYQMRRASSHVDI
jgi:hypothetical protein